MNLLSTWKKIMIGAVTVVIIVGGAYFTWRYFQKAPVTGESQRQAETPLGIDKAAHNAQVKMYEDKRYELRLFLT